MVVFLWASYPYGRVTPAALPKSGCLVIFTPHVDMSERRINFRSPQFEEPDLISWKGSSKLELFSGPLNIFVIKNVKQGPVKVCKRLQF